MPLNTGVKERKLLRGKGNGKERGNGKEKGTTDLTRGLVTACLTQGKLIMRKDTIDHLLIPDIPIPGTLIPDTLILVTLTRAIQTLDTL